jgi:membrane protease YdiL (CAAX protease family)
VSALTSQELHLVVVAAIAAVSAVLVTDLAIAVAWLWTNDGVAAGLRPPLFAPRWSLLDPWLAAHLITVGLLGAGVVGAVAMAPWAVQHSSQAGPSLSFVLAVILLQNGLMVAVPLGFILLKYGASLSEIGLATPRIGHLVLGVAAGVGMCIVGAGASAGVLALAKAVLPGNVPVLVEHVNSALSAGELFPDVSRSWWRFAALFLGVAVAAPIGEEVFFRAFLHRCATRRLGRWTGTLVSASAFALVHGGPILVLAILPMGVLLAWAYDRTGSLWVPITMHAVNNGLMALALRYAPELAK